MTKRFIKTTVSFQFKDAYYAIRTNRPDKLQLIESVPDVNEQDETGDSLLWAAALTDDYAVAKYLLEHGANPNVQEKDGWTPLHLCAQNYSVHVASLLLEHGADCNIKDNHGNTAIFRAVFFSKNRSEMIRLLLEHNADAYEKNNYGISAFDLAQSTKQVNVMELLITDDSK